MSLKELWKEVDKVISDEGKVKQDKSLYSRGNVVLLLTVSTFHRHKNDSSDTVEQLKKLGHMRVSKHCYHRFICNRQLTQDFAPTKS